MTMAVSSMPRLVLASSSPFRRELLAKLCLPFEQASPDVDESPLVDETPQDLVVRLAVIKAQALSERFSHHLIIGSDQLAIGPQGKPLGKPHTHEKAVQQLLSMSGQRITFVTGLCLLNSATGRAQSHCERFDVVFRELSQDQVERYVEQEQPLNCAGSFKSEGLGIALFSALEGRDPNALVGLPLIALVEMLANESVFVP